jgi:hypothetical protein
LLLPEEAMPSSIRLHLAATQLGVLLGAVQLCQAARARLQRQPAQQQQQGRMMGRRTSSSSPQTTMTTMTRTKPTLMAVQLIGTEILADAAQLMLPELEAAW